MKQVILCTDMMSVMIIPYETNNVNDDTYNILLAIFQLNLG